MIIEKSRDLMISWLCVGFFTHAAMTNDQREVLFQSQREDKAAELVDYAKTLYEELRSLGIQAVPAPFASASECILPNRNFRNDLPYRSRLSVFITTLLQCRFVCRVGLP